MEFTPAGVLRQCPTCRAPMVAPFPPGWSLDLIKNGPREGPVTSAYRPHLPGCPDPAVGGDLLGLDGTVIGHAINVSGRSIVAVEVDIAGAAVASVAFTPPPRPPGQEHPPDG